MKLKHMVLGFLLLGVLAYAATTYFFSQSLSRKPIAVIDPIHFRRSLDMFINMNGTLKSPMSPGLNWCFSNPFLAAYDHEIALALEYNWYRWSETQFQSVYDILRLVAPSPEVHSGHIVQILYPNASHLPCLDRSGLIRFGKSLDAGKVLCGVATLAASTECIVYSLGSNNNFEFEEALAAKTSCEIHTYDCTSSPPKNSIPRHTFHKICMGEKVMLPALIFPVTENSNKSNRTDHTFKRLSEIMRENNHSNVYVLKMDIEGAEFGVFADIFNSKTDIHLPFQISFESHWWYLNFHHAILHQQLFAQLWKKGYRLMHHEVNAGDSSCVEWTLLRVFC
jgi:FkbM family methyltransferase